MKKFIICSINLLLWGITSLVYANAQTVNILTWWGYLDYPWVSTYIKKECHVNISYDEYYDNQNFIERYEENRGLYDIIIFEEPSYVTIKSLIPDLPSSKMYKHVDAYNPIVKRHYLDENYPHNIGYFFQSVTGILWNNKNMVIKEHQDIKSALKNKENYLVVLLDDPLYFYMLFQNNNEANAVFSYKNFSSVFGNNTVIITNSVNQNTYASSSFALAYQWSGEAINNYEELPKTTQRHLRFSVSPNYSFISSDMIAQLNNKRSTDCVANVLASKQFLTKLQLDTYYFSPYTDIEDVSKSFFKEVYIDYMKALPKLVWINNYPESFRDKIGREWDYIKLKTTMRFQKNDN